ncbi:DNA recombination protein RmuC [Novispirillum itersonii]|uniref:DNA recombination protein RmuC n=1 Tax=Novispirillum itersonii TaxID=189 RepID=UPI0003674E27|nr:DNA recombination protein RmuC [Novispirillum itersonii]
MGGTIWGDGLIWVFVVVAILACAGAVAAIMVALRVARHASPLPGGGDFDQTARALYSAQAELAGRMAQMAQAQAAANAQLAERMHHQERTVSRVLEERLAEMSRRVGEGLHVTTERTFAHMNALGERLAVIDAAQKTIQDLSSQIIGLQDILSNKQARGAFGEVQLNDLITGTLPPSAYRFQAVLSNGRRADCLLALPNPPGPIVVDAKFPLESYYALRNAADDTGRIHAGRAFAADVLKHVRDIAEKYIIAGETAESALMFLPSEAVYAELHASFPEVVEKSYRARVWIVSPTTLMATLNTVRAVLKDARMREQAGVIQGEVEKLLEDVSRLDSRVGKLATHFAQAQDDIRQVQISTDKITKRAERIEDVQIGDDRSAPDAAPPQQQPLTAPPRPQPPERWARGPIGHPAPGPQGPGPQTQGRQEPQA